MGTARTNEERKQMLSLFDNGLTRVEISKLTKIPLGTVNDTITKYYNHTYKNKEKQQQFEATFDIIVNYYTKDNLSIRQIMKKTGLARTHIINVLQRHNIEIIPAQDYLVKNSKLWVNYNAKNSKLGIGLSYFDEITPHAAYILGVIWGDGCVHYNNKTNKYCVNITCEDLDILQSVNIYFGGNFEIKTIKNSKACKIDIWSKELTEILYEKFKVRSPKAHNLPWIDMPNDMYQYFISGLHSTDGCNYVHHLKNKHGNKIYECDVFVWTYTSVCYDFIVKIKQYIENILSDKIFTLVERIHPKGNKSYSITASGRKAIRLCGWMYENTNYLTRCERKYQKYLPWKDHQFKR